MKQPNTRLPLSLPSRLTTPAMGAAGLTLLFIGLTLWWLIEDNRVPTSATAAHVNIGLHYFDAFRAGDPLGWFQQFHFAYPPFTHLVGVLGVAIGGVGTDAPTLAQNLVFIPLLVLGCYGTAKIAFGNAAGLAAAAFALGTPMVVSQSHEFLLDLPTTSLAAVSVWLLLASERFEKTGYSLAAGVAIGLGFMTKSPFVIFVAGPILVMLARGGWRRWPNVLLCAVAVFAVAGPWYVDHYYELKGYTAGAVAGPPQGPERGTHEDFTWYAWNLVNNQLYIPFTLLFATGLFYLGRQWLRSKFQGWSPNDYTPELLIGGLTGWIGTSLLSINDARYTLPCLVYISVLGTWWIAKRRDRIARVGLAILVAAFASNIYALTFGVGEHRLSLPSPSTFQPYERQFTLIAPPGYIEGRGEPVDDGAMRLLQKVKAAGTRQVYLGGGIDDYRYFNTNGIALFMRIVGLGHPPNNDPLLLGKRDLFMVRNQLSAVPATPCLRLTDGTGVYLVRPAKRPPAEIPAKRYDVFCG